MACLECSCQELPNQQHCVICCFDRDLFLSLTNPVRIERASGGTKEKEKDEDEEEEE